MADQAQDKCPKCGAPRVVEPRGSGRQPLHQFTCGSYFARKAASLLDKPRESLTVTFSCVERQRDAARAEVAALKAENEALKAALAETATDQLLREGLHDNAVEVERILARVLRVPEGSRLIDEWGELAEAALADAVPREVALASAAHAFEEGWDEGCGKGYHDGTRSKSSRVAAACLARAEAEHKAKQKGADT